MTAASKNFSLSQVANVLDITANGAVIGINAANYASNLGPIGNVTITGGSNGQVLSTNGNGTLTWSTVDTSNAANANYSAYAGNITVSAQPNITSLGTLSGLTSNGTVNFTNASNVSLGAVGNVKITGGSNAQVLTTDGSGSLSWATPAAGGNASYVTGQFAVFAAGPPDNTWLKTGLSYNSNSYPSLAPIFASYTANNSATSTAWGWGNTPSIFYGGGRYIGIEASSVAPGAKRTKYSTDGVTWTAGDTLPNITAGQWSNFITWNGSVFFVVNYGTGSRIAATSPDGVTWTQRTLPVVVGNNGWYSVTSLGSTLVAAEYTSTGTTTQVATSTDNGATWTTGTIPFTTVGFVSGNNTMVIAAKENSTLSAYSTNGTTWTQGGTLPTSVIWTGAAWNGKYWMMSNRTGASTIAAKSFDGISWYAVSLPADITFRMSWSGKHWLIYYGSGGSMYYTYDPTVAGWRSVALNRNISSVFQLTTDGTGNSFIVYDTPQDRIYTYTMTVASTFTVSGGSSPNDWFIKL